MRRESDPVTIRRVETLAEYHECVAIQRETWGTDFHERVPATILLVTQKLGGVCAAAFAPDGRSSRMLGFVFGMTGIRDGRLAHWSDMLAVRAEARGSGLGERLKRYQRDLVRAIGVETMYWTFDPLQARNAHLNLNRLGARAAEYVPNMYGGDTGSPLHGALETDRFVAAWDLGPTGGVATVPDDSAAIVRVPVPRDVDALPYDERAAWRARTRDAILSYFARGYGVVGFRRGDGDEMPAYELAPGA